MLDFNIVFKDYISLTYNTLSEKCNSFTQNRLCISFEKPLSFLFFVWREGKGKAAYLCKAWNRMSWPSVLPSALWRREGHGRCVRVRRVAFVRICWSLKKCHKTGPNPKKTRFFNKWLQTSKHFWVFVALTSSLTWNSGELRWIAVIVTKMDSGFPSNRMSNWPKAPCRSIPQHQDVAIQHIVVCWDATTSDCTKSHRLYSGHDLCRMASGSPITAGRV